MSAAAPTVGSDTEIIETLDFDPEMGCEGLDWGPDGKFDCQVPAVWAVACAFCSRAPIFLCDEHVQMLRARAARFGGVRCDECGTVRDSWGAITRLVPIGGRL